jgi:AAA15 family ATPase/GTPase
MLKTLLLKNFKSFAGVHQIPLAPLTLIFGKNSAGKSSIIQSLVFLKQSSSSLIGSGQAVWTARDDSRVRMVDVASDTVTGSHRITNLLVTPIDGGAPLTMRHRR